MASTRLKVASVGAERKACMQALSVHNLALRIAKDQSANFKAGKSELKMAQQIGVELANHVKTKCANALLTTYMMYFIQHRRYWLEQQISITMQLSVPMFLSQNSKKHGKL